MTKLDRLTTEASNPASDRIDSLAPLDIVRVIIGEDARIVPAVAKEEAVIARAIEMITDRLRTGGRLVYIGAGTSGRLGVLDASECPPTFNTDPKMVVGLIAGGDSALRRAIEGAEDVPESGVVDLKKINLSAGDAVVGIATSGGTPIPSLAAWLTRDRSARRRLASRAIRKPISMMFRTLLSGRSSALR